MELQLAGNILITGGSGFLARGIMRRAQRDNWNCHFTCYSRNEELQQRAKAKYAARYVLGDILDFERLRLAMIGHETVIHTAALKYIPECEANPGQCVKMNIDGSRSVMQAARDAGVKRVVMISTDKAPQPVNVYGMTKAVMERLVHETFGEWAPAFTAVRYGNVINSTGSVWPSWKQQAERDGHIKLTNPTMTRYFMGIDQAVDTVVHAAINEGGGMITLPFPCAAEMGRLAAYVATHLGVSCNRVGPRPGEKVHEQMVSSEELPRIMALREDAAYLYLLPPGLKPERESVDANSLLTSSKPPCWMEPEQFVALALDSEDV